MQFCSHIRQPAFVYFGSEALDVLPELLERFIATRPFLVLDAGLASSETARRLTSILPPSTEVFSDTRPDPDVELTDAVAGKARRARADLVIGVGGGSAMDVAKAVSVLCTNSGSAAEYQGFHLVKQPGLPKIMVPATTGSGAEATWSAVLINRKLGRKGGINSPYVLPNVAVLDPAVTMSAPREVAVSSCLDAVTHAIESYTAKNATMMSRLHSDAALRLLLGSVERACDPSTRTETVMLNMLQGSYLAAVAIGGSETGPCHALGYPLGAHFGVSHGLANAILLPHVMRFNLPACTEVYALVSELLDPDTAPLPTKARAARAPELMARLVHRLGLRSSLRDFGVKESMLSDLAAKGLELRGPLDNAPREVDLECARRIYADSLSDYVTTPP